MKNMTSARPTAQAALLSALLNICLPPLYRRHNVVREHHDSQENHHAAQRRAGQLEFLVHDHGRSGLLRDAVAGRLLAGLAVEQSGDSVHRHGEGAATHLAGALLQWRDDFPGNRDVRIQHYGDGSGEEGICSIKPITAPPGPWASRWSCSSSAD